MIERNIILYLGDEKMANIKSCRINFTQEPPRRSMSERAEQIAKDLDLEAKLHFYDNWAEAVINGYFVFSDGSEIKVPVKRDFGGECMKDDKCCRCGRDGEEAHGCPYQEDVNSDYETLCNCCEECQHQCCMDI